MYCGGVRIRLRRSLVAKAGAEDAHEVDCLLYIEEAKSSYVSMHSSDSISFRITECFHQAELAVHALAVLKQIGFTVLHSGKTTTRSVVVGQIKNHGAYTHYLV